MKDFTNPKKPNYPTGENCGRFLNAELARQGAS